MSIHIKQNNGIISTGSYSNNTIYNGKYNSETVDWDKLQKEVLHLKTSTDDLLKQFAAEAVDPVKKKDIKSVQQWLSKWIPVIGQWIENSYYILEIASKFGIGN